MLQPCLFCHTGSVDLLGFSSLFLKLTRTFLIPILFQHPAQTCLPGWAVELDFTTGWEEAGAWLCAEGILAAPLSPGCAGEMSWESSLGERKSKPRWRQQQLETVCQKRQECWSAPCPAVIAVTSVQVTPEQGCSLNPVWVSLPCCWGCPVSPNCCPCALPALLHPGVSLWGFSVPAVPGRVTAVSQSLCGTPSPGLFWFFPPAAAVP